VSTEPLQLAVTQIDATHPTSSVTRDHLVRRGRALSILTLVWMSVEAGVSLTAAVAAGSVSLLGFGLDSVIELASAGTILWLYTHQRSSATAAERRAQQLVTLCLLALAAYVTFDAIHALTNGSHPHTSWLGVGVCLGAIVFMPLLARAKSRVAVQLASAATAGDAAQSRLCAISAAAVLITLLANHLAGWWWLDPITGLGIAALALYEARNAWAGEVCADCAPMRLQDSGSCGCDDPDCR
jgi:divalent metal cation (Fe/Co/Zn/Cd) transporter